ncbi:MAG TPA: helix-turn-helix domain-containing protein [Acidimicrobiales bacterium]|nr:helix-turn-helix domain-containing protein [Acidimicrobiales bacterium]
MTSGTADSLTEQARALGDPTRNAIFRYVDAAARPVGVAELTEHFELNHNAIRQHLAKLRDAGLLVEGHAEPDGPGRPALLYRPNPGAAGRWESGSPYEQLAALLVEVLQTGDEPRIVGRRAGQRLAKEARESDRVGLLEALTRRLGFEPRVVERRGRVDVVLDRCPFVMSAIAAPEIVCALHRGLAEGVVDSGPRGVRVRDLVVRPAKRAGCRIVLDVE